MNQAQIEAIADKFANEQVDNMDMDTLMQIAYDQLFEYYSACTAEELEEEIISYNCGDEEAYAKLVESTKAAAWLNFL